MSAYLRVYGIILLPGAVFVTAVSLFLNVVLRNKYLVYVVSIGTASGLFYLYNLGYNHWLYNPMLYQLWNYGELTQQDTLRAIVFHRGYILLIAISCLVGAHLLFPRKATASRRGRWAATGDR